MTKRTHYTREFKLEAVRQLQTDQKPTSTLALELGVKRAVLYRWRDELAFNGVQAFARYLFFTPLSPFRLMTC